MSDLILTKQAAPTNPATGKKTLYVNLSGQFVVRDEAGAELIYPTFADVVALTGNQTVAGTKTFTSPISVGGLLTTNGQIAFPATQNPSSDPNALDDYEEGTWTPTITAGTGTFTTVSATGVYTKAGRLLSFVLFINITANGTAAVSISATLPFNAGTTGIGNGRENAVTGNQLHAYMTGITANITTYNNTYPGVNGGNVWLSGVYFTA